MEEFSETVKAAVTQVTIKHAILTLSDAVPSVLKRFEEVKDNIAELLKFYRQLRDANSQIDQLCKILNELEQNLSYKIIPDIMETMQMDSLKSGGYTYSVNVRNNASIPLDKREKGLQWLKNNGLSAIISETVNAKTLSSAVTQHIVEKGLIPPEDAISLHQQKYISVRKS